MQSNAVYSTLHTNNNIYFLYAVQLMLLCGVKQGFPPYSAHTVRADRSGKTWTFVVVKSPAVRHEVISSTGGVSKT